MPRPQLALLARRLGILPRYRAAGVERHTSDETRVGLAAAMGFDAATERGAARALAEIDARRRAALIDPVQLIADAGAFRLRWHDEPPGERRVTFEFELVPEDGGEARTGAGSARIGAGGRVSGITLPVLAPGIHELRLSFSGQGARREARQTLIAGATACVAPGEILGRRRGFGIWANLYSIRGPSDFGIGNLGDAARLARLAGRNGADFVGLSPLQAVRNRGHEISPYSPLSRLFRNPIYLDAALFPELRDCGAARALLASRGFVADREALRRAARIDHEGVTALLEPLLEALHRRFAIAHRGRSTSRGRAYAAFRAQGGEELERFAIFAALEEELARRGYPRDWRAWPVEYRSPDSAAVREFRRGHGERVDYHVFLQFELDRQLARAARAGRDSGLTIGLYQDLPLGSVASGFDAWAFPGLVATGASLGAPPDRYAAGGQDWALPPLLPHALALDGYRFWSRLLRANLAHAGALRLDHAMALLRQFWIPEGGMAEKGAYVRFPFEELVSVLALESRRANALIVAEDLGTVPAGFQSMLARHGLLSSRVLFFERRRGGAFRRAREYSSRALVSVDTHDMHTLSGFWHGRDLEIRHGLGLLDAAQLDRGRTDRVAERAALVRRLELHGALDGGHAPSVPELCAAVHRFVSATPAPLVALSLDDLAGELEPVNVPGVSPERYPSWTRRMSRSLDALARSPDFRRGLSGARSRARPR